MGWETRKRGSSYYCRSKWVDGQVVREYIGTGTGGREPGSSMQGDPSSQHPHVLGSAGSPQHIWCVSSGQGVNSHWQVSGCIDIGLLKCKMGRRGSVLSFSLALVACDGLAYDGPKPLPE